MNRSLLRTFPVTITVSALALVAWACPTLTLWLQLDFKAVADGQWWRIWTGHLTHYDGNHLFWDLIMFVVLAGACEHRHRRRFALALTVMVAVISASIGYFCDQVSVYRGLSGIDTGLFVWFVADQCHDCWRSRDRVSALLWLSLSMGLIGKLLYEVTTGQILFVDASGFTPLVESHLAGAAIGLVCYSSLFFFTRPRLVITDVPRPVRKAGLMIASGISVVEKKPMSGFWFSSIFCCSDSPSRNMIIGGTPLLDRARQAGSPSIRSSIVDKNG